MIDMLLDERAQMCEADGDKVGAKKLRSAQSSHRAERERYQEIPQDNDIAEPLFRDRREGIRQGKGMRAKAFESVWQGGA